VTQYPKIKQERLSSVIARQLERMILEGVLSPGDRLPPERELAEELEVSRPSLREALQKLEASGLLETRHGGGTYVRNAIADAITEPLAEIFQRHPEAALDFLELRGTLDGMSAYYAALRGTEEDRTIISRRYEAMKKAHTLEDPTEEAERDADFHMSLAEASHNVILLHVMRGLLALLRKDVVFNRMQLYSCPGARDMLLEQHRSIFEAVIAGEADRARQAAQQHMTHVHQFLRERRLSDWRVEMSRRRLDRDLNDGNRDE
jgi:Transcriptional regulators